MAKDTPVYSYKRKGTSKGVNEWVSKEVKKIAEDLKYADKAKKHTKKLNRKTVANTVKKGYSASATAKHVKEQRSDTKKHNQRMSEIGLITARAATKSARKQMKKS